MNSLRGGMKSPGAVSDVSGMGNFVLGLDLDGVCADYTDGFRQYVAGVRGIPAETLPDPVAWDFTKCGWGIETEQEYLALHAAAVADGLFRRLVPIDGVSDALWQLSNAGVRIRVITHRLFVSGSHRVAAADTVAWLDDKDIPYWDLCFVADKPQVGADLYIDDSPTNLASFRAAGLNALVFDQPYNRDVPGRRVASWLAATEAVLACRRAKPTMKRPDDPMSDRVQKINDPRESWWN